MLTEVLISSEDRDNFIKNMLTVRAEERIALAVKIPECLRWLWRPHRLDVKTQQIGFHKLDRC